MQQAVRELGVATDALCRSPSETALGAARMAFRRAIAAWGRVEILEFGPIKRNNRFERVFFWPDRKSIGARQVRRLLARQDAAIATPDVFAKKSVAVQGLTAFEMLIHGAGAEALAKPPVDQFRCRYAKAIVGNLASMFARVVQAWGDGGAFAKLWLRPSNDNPVYLQQAETTLELVKAFDQAIAMARDRRIVPAIGFGPRRRVRRPVLWRSGLGMVLIHANLTAARDLLRLSGIADAYLKARSRARDAEGEMARAFWEFEKLLETTGRLAQQVRPFKAPETKMELIAIGFPLKSLRLQTVPQIKAVAGLSIGFNASDGD